MRNALYPLALVAALSLGGCGGSPLPEEIEVDPYLGYFVSMRIDGEYLFEAFEAKQAFDSGEATPVFEIFVSRTGQKVMIATAPQAATDVVTSSDKDEDVIKVPMVERIARGFELQEGTELFRLQDQTAPAIVIDEPEQLTTQPATQPVSRPDLLTP